PVANLSALLRSFPHVRLRIAGHREETGDTVEDEGLSLVPAVALEALLVKAGTPADRIPTWDFGSAEPQDTRGPGEEPAHRGAAREVVMGRGGRRASGLGAFSPVQDGGPRGRSLWGRSPVHPLVRLGRSGVAQAPGPVFPRHTTSIQGEP